MPVFDTPITTNDASYERVLAQSLPQLVYLFERPDERMNEALERLASGEAGKLLVVRINAAENPKAYERLGRPPLPAIATLQDGELKSKTTPARLEDIKAHAEYALGRGLKPGEAKPTQPPKPAAAKAQGTAPNTPIHTSEATFNRDVLESDLPVLVDFWAPWCGPCHMIAPTLEKLAQQYAGQVKIAKLNVDENQSLSGRYQVSGIPQLLMFKNGQVVGKLVGAHPQPNIEQLIRQALN